MNMLNMRYVSLNGEKKEGQLKEKSIYILAKARNWVSWLPF
jgi:hypothetical protein